MSELLGLTTEHGRAVLDSSLANNDTGSVKHRLSEGRLTNPAVTE